MIDVPYWPLVLIYRERELADMVDSDPRTWGVTSPWWWRVVSHTHSAFNASVWPGPVSSDIEKTGLPVPLQN